MESIMHYCQQEMHQEEDLTAYILTKVRDLFDVKAKKGSFQFRIFLLGSSENSDEWSNLKILEAISNLENHFNLYHPIKQCNSQIICRTMALLLLTRHLEPRLYRGTSDLLIESR